MGLGAAPLVMEFPVENERMEQRDGAGPCLGDLWVRKNREERDGEGKEKARFGMGQEHPDVSPGCPPGPPRPWEYLCRGWRKPG